MLRRQHTSLASVTLQNADKLRDWKTPMETLIKQLQAAGEDYADAVNQAELVVRNMEDMYDKTLDLAGLILKADRAKALAVPAPKPSSQEGLDRKPGDRRLAEPHQQPDGDTPPGSSPSPTGDGPPASPKRPRTT